MRVARPNAQDALGHAARYWQSSPDFYRLGQHRCPCDDLLWAWSATTTTERRTAIDLEERIGGRVLRRKGLRPIPTRAELQEHASVVPCTAVAGVAHNLDFEWGKYIEKLRCQHAVSSGSLQDLVRRGGLGLQSSEQAHRRIEVASHGMREARAMLHHLMGPHAAETTRIACPRGRVDPLFVRPRCQSGGHLLWQFDRPTTRREAMDVVWPQAMNREPPRPTRVAAAMSSQ